MHRHKSPIVTPVENGWKWQWLNRRIGLLANMAQKKHGCVSKHGATWKSRGWCTVLGPHFSESICLEVAQQGTHTHTHIIRIIYIQYIYIYIIIYIYYIHMHMFPLNHLQMSMYRISVISSRPRSPPPGVDEIAAVAKAITETEGRRGPVASVGLGKTHGFDRGPWKMHGETRWNPVKPWNMLKMSYKCWLFRWFSEHLRTYWRVL